MQKYANLTISYHPLYIKNDNKFIEKILQLSYGSIHIMLEHEHLDRAEYVYKKLKDFQKMSKKENLVLKYFHQIN